MPNLTIFYTYQLRGDFALLPRLYTFLQELKKDHEHVLLMDLGDSCDKSVWHCGVTGGRSTLIVLDGMGYHGANVTGFLKEGERDKLNGVITTALIDNSHAWRLNLPLWQDEGIIISSEPTPAHTLNIVLAPNPQTALHEGTLFLQSVEKGQVGMARIIPEKGLLAESALHTIPEKTAPHPLIIGAVEFVEDEARYYQKKG